MYIIGKRRFVKGKHKLKQNHMKNRFNSIISTNGFAKYMQLKEHKIHYYNNTPSNS